MDQTFQQNLQDQLADISQSLSYLMPEAILGSFLVLLLLWELFSKKLQDSRMAGFSILGLVLCIYFLPFEGRSHLFEGSLTIDGISSFGKLLFVGSGIVSLLFLQFQGKGKEKVKKVRVGVEYYLLFLGLILGLFFLSMAIHLLYVYLSLELVSICSYLLTAYEKKGSKQAEAAIKYIIFGASSSGIMLYGISWIYGFTGTLLPSTSEFIRVLNEVPPEAQILGFSLIFSGFLFKVAAFPFHFWSPDVYEGISFPLAGFFSVAPKAAGFIALLRLLHSLKGAETFPFLLMILGTLALMGMSIANLLALRQRNIKRLLAYSGIAHAGFLLIALICMPGIGPAALLFYLSVYTLLNLSAFMLGGFFSELSNSENFTDWAGLGKIAAWGGVLFAICLAGLIGLPPTGGFIAKWYVFVALFEQSQEAIGNFWIFLIIGTLINILISIFYYLRPLIYVFLKPMEKDGNRRGNTFIYVFSTILLVPVLILGMYKFDQFINHLQNILWN